MKDYVRGDKVKVGFVEAKSTVAGCKLETKYRDFKFGSRQSDGMVVLYTKTGVQYGILRNGNLYQFRKDGRMRKIGESASVIDEKVEFVAEKVAGQRQGLHEAAQRQLEFLKGTMKGAALRKAVKTSYGLLLALANDRRPGAYSRSLEVRTIQHQVDEALALYRREWEQLDKELGSEY